MQVAIIGAGLCGLTAGRSLSEAGADVTLFDKGRSPGGRLATRRIGASTFDHGAQFFTVRTPAFARQVEDWEARGYTRVWNEGFDGPDGHPRYVATAGMNSLAKDLAVGQTVKLSTMVFAIRRHRNPQQPGWCVAIDDGTSFDADAVIVTCPLPQTFALLVDADIALDETLFRTDYERTVCLLARLDRPVDLSPAGGLQSPDDVFGFIGDNQHKGVSAEPALTFHANPAWSAAHWDDSNDDLASQLVAASQPWLGDALIVEQHVKKWRLATPSAIWPDPCWTAADGTIVVAGDAFAGPRMEGAHNSGLAAAHALLG